MGNLLVLKEDPALHQDSNPETEHVFVVSILELRGFLTPGQASTWLPRQLHERNRLVETILLLAVYRFLSKPKEYHTCETSQ